MPPESSLHFQGKAKRRTVSNTARGGKHKGIISLNVGGVAKSLLRSGGTENTRRVCKKDEETIWLKRVKLRNAEGKTQDRGGPSRGGGAVKSWKTKEARSF